MNFLSTKACLHPIEFHKDKSHLFVEAIQSVSTKNHNRSSSQEIGACYQRMRNLFGNRPEYSKKEDPKMCKDDSRYKKQQFFIKYRFNLENKQSILWSLYLFFDDLMEYESRLMIQNLLFPVNLPLNHYSVYLFFINC